MYMLFAGAYYYPSGGWKDYVGTFASIEEAKNHLKNEDDKWLDWWQIVLDGKIVEHGKCGNYATGGIETIE